MGIEHLFNYFNMIVYGFVSLFIMGLIYDITKLSSIELMLYSAIITIINKFISNVIYNTFKSKIQNTFLEKIEIILLSVSILIGFLFGVSANYNLLYKSLKPCRDALFFLYFLEIRLIYSTKVTAVTLLTAIHESPRHG